MIRVDVAGFLSAAVRRAHAPRGRTPVLPAPLTRDHSSVSNGPTVDGRLCTHIEDRVFDGAASGAFPRQLLRQVRGELLVLWNGGTDSSLPRGQGVPGRRSGSTAAVGAVSWLYA